MTSSILIIEHHEDHRALLQSALREESVAIETVDTGEAALLRLGTTDFDCVVLGSPVPVTFGSESSTILDLFDLLAPNLAPRLTPAPVRQRSSAATETEQPVAQDAGEA